ncbi:MAG: 2-phospho-L-lactate transferase [Acidimicrobiales bacterium]
MIVALAGGVGAARLLRGMVAVSDPAQLTAIVNTADDTVMHGLHISPDLDTVTYTLAGVINAGTGWGLTDESWRAMDELAAYSGGRLGWFRLGDRDLGTHLYRTSRLGEGAPLSQITTEIAARWRIGVRILPMSDDAVETRVTLAEPPQREISFQDYFVGHRHSVAVRSVRLVGAEVARPAPGVIEAIAAADRVVICPSNPIVSIGPVLATGSPAGGIAGGSTDGHTGGIAAAMRTRRADAVAVSPIVAGRALKGPADRLLAELGHEPSVVGVARLWAPYAATLVVDHADAGLAPQVEQAGMVCVVTETVMKGPAQAAALARAVLDGAATPV